MRPLVLIVDDTPLARKMMRQYLEPRGYFTVEAGSTAEAIRVYRESWPDVVTMDMLMDGHNGIIAIQALQRIDHRVKIIVCSATSNQSFVAGAASLGVEAYLNKPIDPDRLVASIEAALAKREGET
jgi:two-component system chemotaxis response regulator CheY